MDPNVDATDFVDFLASQITSEPADSVFDFTVAPVIPPEVEELENLLGGSRRTRAPSNEDQERQTRRRIESNSTSIPIQPSFLPMTTGSTSVSIACTGDHYFIDPMTALWHRYSMLDSYFLYGMFGPLIGNRVPGRFLAGLQQRPGGVQVSRQWIEDVCIEMSKATGEPRALRGENFCAVIGFGIVFSDNENFAVALGDVQNYEARSTVDKEQHDFFVRYTSMRENGIEYPVTDLVVPDAVVLKNELKLIKEFKMKLEDK